MPRKAKTIKQHARRRFHERYGITLTTDQERKLIRQIQSGYATLIEKQSNNRSVFRVKLKTDRQDVLDTVTVVYDKIRRSIVTVFPPDEKTHISKEDRNAFHFN